MSAQNARPPAFLSQAMHADQHRLLMAWRRLPAPSDSSAPRVVAWHSQVEASIARRQRRSTFLVPLQYDTDLPITAHREELVELIRTRQTLVVCGETGSGKSTQLPKFCLEAGLGVGAMIGHTQPRRLAARAVASRLAEELHTRVGEGVGFKIRFTDATNPDTLIKLMTDGVLLAETQSDRFLNQYDALIIDEAHERSLNIDFLLGFLRQLTTRRPELKLIITSATIDPQRFAEHFADSSGPAPIVEVSGRTYPVEMRYRPFASESASPEEQMALLAASVNELTQAGSGDILIFLPTERDIREAAKHLRGHLTRTHETAEILPLYARLSQAEQNKIFASHGGRRIVLATNVAESSLTVPGIRYVIDTGLARISRYAPRSKIQRLPIESISQASANQRAGRCGRLGPGICIRLYSEDDYNSRSRFTTPEIRRSDLASVMLQSKVLHLGPLAEFPLLDPPSAESLRDAEKTLRELGAMDEQGELTKTGRQLGKLPCDPRVGRMLLEASERQCLAEVVIIAAALETQDVRQRPAGQRPQADQAHQRFLDPHSDFLDYIRLWDYYDRLRAELGRSRLQKALGQTFLSYQGFREWSDIVRQLKELLTAAGIDSGGRRYRLPDLDLQQIQAEQSELAEQRQPRNSRSGHSARTAPKRSLERPAGYAAIHQSLLSGLLSGIARRGERGDYQASGGLTIALWPGSGLFRRRPLWIMAAEIVETSKRYGRTVAEVDVEWIESAAGELLKHSYSDPHWSSKTGSAMVVRRSTLYGLPIVTDRKVGLASVDREAARDMLIEHGLVGGEWTCREAFYLHNLELLADMHELAQRTRSREYILDRFHLSAFYSQRLPSQLHDLNSLRAWLRAHQGTPEERGLWMNSDDLLRGSEEKTSFELEFPNALRIDSTELPLTYHFEPGHTADGVSLTLPQAALRQVSDDVLGWLVPGMLEEKILFLIRSLPKNLRTSFVPAPDVAKHLCEQLNKISRQQPFNAALCEVMSRHAGERITPSCFAVEKLPDHLHFLIRVVDDQGALIATGRQLGELQSKCLPTASTLDEATTAVDDDWTNRTVTPTDFESFPTQVIVRRGGLAVAAFPALVDLGDRVELRLADTLSEAERISRQGLTRLLALKHHRTLRNQVTHLPNYTAASVRIAYLMQAKERSQELTNQLQDLIARMALVEGQAPITQREDFEARNALATSRISVATQEVAAWLPKLAEQMHQVRLLTESAPLSWKEVFDDIAVQLVHLVHPNFLKETPWQWLAEYPRYLQAINLRVEKLKSGGLPKDRKLREPIEAAWAFHQELVARGRVQSPDFQPRLEELRWTIEELRVSIFAQQLGTKISVSPKRVQSIIEALKSQL